MVTLSLCLIWLVISFIHPQNEYGCVYTWTTLRWVGMWSAYRRCRFWQKKIIVSDEADVDLGGYINKQNCRVWDTENPQAYIEKPTHQKRATVWCGFWSRIIIRQFFSKMTRWDRYSQWRSLSGQVNRIFVHKNWRGGYWQHLVPTEWRYAPHCRSYTRCFAPCFWRSH